MTQSTDQRGHQSIRQSQCSAADKRRQARQPGKRRGQPRRPTCISRIHGQHKQGPRRQSMRQENRTHRHQQPAQRQHKCRFKTLGGGGCGHARKRHRISAHGSSRSNRRRAPYGLFWRGTAPRRRHAPLCPFSGRIYRFRYYFLSYGLL